MNVYGMVEIDSLSNEIVYWRLANAVACSAVLNCLPLVAARKLGRRESLNALIRSTIKDTYF